MSFIWARPVSPKSVGAASPAAVLKYRSQLELTTDGLFTFVDGDVSLPSAGGKGLLVVTGTLSMNGSQTFDGLVLVLGGGVIDRSGGGNGTSLGAFVVARFNSTGDFLVPSFTSSGSGTSWIQLDRNKVKSALRLGGIPVLCK